MIHALPFMFYAARFKIHVTRRMFHTYMAEVMLRAL